MTATTRRNWLDMHCESGTSHQQQGQETKSENVEGKAEAGPPHWGTRVLNARSMKEFEYPVSGERGHNQP
jgi:hypothetical protein